MLKLNIFRDALLITLILLLVYVLYRRLLHLLRKDKIQSEYPNLNDQLTLGSDGEVQVDFEFQKPTNARISLHDASNNEVMEIENRDFNSGKNHVRFSMKSFATGRYYYKIQTPNQASSRYFEIS